MMSTTQQELVSELRQPDIEVPVRKIYDNYFEGIVAHICLNGGNRDDGSDIFQEAVLLLIDKVKTGEFRGESSIKTYLSAIARNLWLHELRTRGRRNNREVAYMSTEEKITEPRQSFFEPENTNALQQLLRQVGEPCKKILNGFYYQNKSMKEMLVDFNYENEQVLRNRKSRCMKKLKELLSTNTGLMKTINPISLYEQ